MQFYFERAGIRIELISGGYSGSTLIDQVDFQTVRLR